MNNYVVGQILVDKNGNLYPIVQVTDNIILVMDKDGETKGIEKRNVDAYTIKEFFFTQASPEKEKEAVDHPAHYTREGSIECIDEMILVFGVEAVKTFCILNAWKYRYRAMDKNGKEDMRKADWYIKKLKELDMPF